MKKNLFITFGIAIALFIYGYLASKVGHDHKSHEKTQSQEKQESHSEHQHSEHQH